MALYLKSGASPQYASCERKPSAPVKGLKGVSCPPMESKLRSDCRSVVKVGLTSCNNLKDAFEKGH